MSNKSAFILGGFVFLGLILTGLIIGNTAVKVKEYERTVNVKGLSEREYEANIVIWPIRFSEANNDIGALYSSIESNTKRIVSFLKNNGIQSSEISISAPDVIDKMAQQYGGSDYGRFRYTSTQSITVYSENIKTVRATMSKLSELGKAGIVFRSDDYDIRPEYIFTNLNEVKPEMIEEATKKAREVAEKFAADSQSKLGKIKRASQGQFSINERDRNNPHIKKVRVVASLTYYLSD